jgi:hypothetical protein
MKIYFGDANDDMFSDGVFECNGNAYYYGVEHGTNPGGLDEVQIFDGCKRKLPIHIEAIPELIAALQEVHNVAKATKEANRLVERSESKIKGYVSRIWHDDFEVDFDTTE